jgi:hypothetical protein
MQLLPLMLNVHHVVLNLGTIQVTKCTVYKGVNNESGQQSESKKSMSIS